MIDQLPVDKPDHLYDIIEVVIAGSGGISLMMLDIEFWMKLLVGCLSGGFIIYKWYWAEKERKERANKKNFEEFKKSQRE